jgi:hypothetical protein
MGRLAEPRPESLTTCPRQTTSPRTRRGAADQLTRATQAPLSFRAIQVPPAGRVGRETLVRCPHRLIGDRWRCGVNRSLPNFYAPTLKFGTPSNCHLWPAGGRGFLVERLIGEPSLETRLAGAKAAPSAPGPPRSSNLPVNLMVTPKIGANRCVPRPGIFMRSGGPMGWGIHGNKARKAFRGSLICGRLLPMHHQHNGHAAPSA